MSRLDDNGGASFRSHSSAQSKPPRPGTSSGLDASGLDGNASVASDATSRTSKPRSQAPSSRPPPSPSTRSGVSSDSSSSRTTSASNLGSSTLRKDDGSDHDDDGDKTSPSERTSKPGSTTPRQRTSGSGAAASRPTSSASLGLSAAADDDGNLSVAAPSERGGNTPRSSAPQRSPPSATSGRSASSCLVSDSNFGHSGVAGAGGDDDDAASQTSSRLQRSPSLSSHGAASGAGLDASLSRSLAVDATAANDDGASSIIATSDRHSKPRSSPAPSHRTSGGGGGAMDRGRQASESNMGFSGFSIAGKEAEDGDDKSSVAVTSERPRLSQRSGTTSSLNPSSRKPSEVSPPGGTSGTLTAGDESLALSESASIDHRSTVKSGSPAVSRKASDTGGASTPHSSRPGGGVSMGGGTSGAVSGGISGAISYSKDDDEAASAAPSSRRRSFASSLRQSVASNKAASEESDSDEEERGSLDGDKTAPSTGLPQSHRAGGDDAASTRSGTSAASRSEKSRSLAPSMSGASNRSASSVALSSHTVTTARSTSAPTTSARSASARSRAKPATEGAEYGEEEFEEEVVETGSGEESVATAPSSAPRRASSAAGSARSGGYSNAFEDAPSASGRHSHSNPAASEAAAGEGKSDDASGLHASGSIFMQPQDAGTPGSARRSGGSVFRRLPADAPDEPFAVVPAAAAAAGVSLSGSIEGGVGSRRPPRSVASSARSADGDWNEGAVRVSAPGAPRGFGSGGGLRARPMSAAPRDRQGALLDGLIRKHPATWDSVDVATWVEFLGLGQYRRRFLHHCIDGRLLLRLTDAQLKSDLGIGPMGHRCAILDAAATLIRDYKEAQRDRLAAGGGDDQDDGGDDDDGGERRDMGRSSTAPRSRPRPASARPGALATPPPPHGARRPASASRSVIPPDPFLGPAMGKVTVYEQRAKLLFELDRAQARAEQHRALAEQLKHTASLSAEEVSHIRGLLLEIEKKNRAAFELSGGLDSAARVPWRHVGNGTKHNNWNPERFARPGDPETVDLTFQPRCTNPESRKLLGLGGGDYGENSSTVNSFLDRLNNDLRKREQSRKELERRYYSDGSGTPQSQLDADLQLVREALQTRCHLHLASDPADYEAQIDEALGMLCNSDSWREANLQPDPIRAARGQAKVVAFASALRSLSFMERYRSDLRSKGSRARALEKKWINQTLGAQYLPGGKDKEDLDEAAKFFALLGWRDGDGNPSEDAIDQDLLDRLLDRAMEYRKQYDAWWERVRDKPEERAAGFKCAINWSNHPWSADGLGALQKDEMTRMGGDGSGANPDGSHNPTQDFVEYTVVRLGKCRQDDLTRMRCLNLRPKRLAVYRAIRTQIFIQKTQEDLEARDRKLREAYMALAPPRRRIEPSRIEGFFERLLEDAAKRRQRAEKIAHEKVLKEQEILASSVMYGRLRTAR